jgi:hypothetical protein
MTRIVCFAILFFSCYFSRAQDSLLNALKKEINLKENYVSVRANRIQQLRASLTVAHPDSLKKIFFLTNQLYHEYKIFIYDSAIAYAHRLSALASRMNDQPKKEYSKLKISFILISAGLFKETFDSLRQIRSKLLPDSSRLEYYNLMARANYDLSDFDNDPFFHRKYYPAANQYLDSGISLCAPNSFSWLDIRNYKFLMNRKTDEGLGDLKELLKLPISDHQRAIANHHLGLLYLQKNDLQKARDAFAVSSIYDIRTATKETASMTDLADLLYKQGDVENAYLFIKHSMEDAVFYGARQRKVRIGSLIPIIAGERLSKSESERQVWLIYSVTLTAVALIVLGFGFIIVRQNKKLKEADRKILDANENLREINHRLREADKIKEEYIGYYFNINSDFLDKIESVKKSIDQKLMARKFDDLQKVADGLNLKREREDLYQGFDHTFIKLFPDFVATFNSYFSEENKMVLKENQILNTELRIFALIRLGIHDTEKIAKILGYSVNTIYAYKTKVKSKSLLPNDEFEAKIKAIKTV